MSVDFSSRLLRGTGYTIISPHLKVPKKTFSRVTLIFGKMLTFCEKTLRPSRPYLS